MSAPTPTPHLDDCFAIAPDLPPGLPIDAITLAIERTTAMVHCIQLQFEGEESVQCSNEIIHAALGALHGQLAQIAALVDHAWKTQPKSKGTRKEGAQ